MSGANGLTIKQGATLQLVVQISNDDGSAFVLAGVTATSQVRDANGHLVANIALATSSTTGQLLVAAPTDTWPLGLLWWDIKLVQGGIVVKSSTTGITVQPAITR